MAREQPTFDPFTAWAAGVIPGSEGVEGDAVSVREDDDGFEILRAPWRNELPAVGAVIARSDVDGRLWKVVDVEVEGGRPTVRMRKEGPPSTDLLPMHEISAPPAIA